MRISTFSNIQGEPVYVDVLPEDCNNVKRVFLEEDKRSRSYIQELVSRLIERLKDGQVICAFEARESNGYRVPFVIGKINGRSDVLARLRFSLKKNKSVDTTCFAIVYRGTRFYFPVAAKKLLPELRRICFHLEQIGSLRRYVHQFEK